jgi:hypothetical protein
MKHTEQCFPVQMSEQHRQTEGRASQGHSINHSNFITLAGIFQKSQVMNGWAMLVCTCMDLNDESLIIGTMLCPPESNKHTTNFSDAIKEKDPWNFSKESKQKLLATADRGAA